MSLLDRFRLDGKVALVTGGGRGLGEQIAEAMAEMGANVVVCSRKLENCQEVAERLAKEKGVKTLALACDVRSEEDLERTFRQSIEEFGKIDILVNNSGASWGANVLEMPLDAWHKVMDINLTAVFLLSRMVAQHMIDNGYGGSIINISSTSGLRASDGSGMDAVGYSVSKSAVNHLTKELAKRWGRYGIRVNAIAPGFFPTKMTKVVLERIGDRVNVGNPMGRIGNDEDLKGLAVFLASEASSYINGQVIAVDGGASA